MITLNKRDNDQHHGCKKFKEESKIGEVIDILCFFNREDKRNEGDRSDKNSEKNYILK